ncbi:MAG: siroheme synthase CysG [Alphaproteobacteria bacterium]|nr:siroheme synthase CysG [Alphaproteobacteria bacterium]
MAFTPLFINAEKHGTILVIGGGEIAAAKTEALASVGAKVEIVAEKQSQAILNLCKKHGFTFHEASYDHSFLRDKKIVVAATNDNDLNAAIAAECNKRNIWVNVVDNPALCDFIFPALVRRGPLQIAISSSGIAPVLARMIKQRIEMSVPESFEKLITYMKERKTKLRESHKNLQPRRLLGEDIINGAIAEEVLEGNTAKADELLDKAIKSLPDTKKGALYLIGAGPGHPELITLKAIRLISQADIILYDRLIPQSLLTQYARKDAAKIAVGKTRNHHLKEQQDIDELIEEHLGKNNIVVRLKGGDPGIFAHGAEEIDIARKMNCPYQIIPGVSAANGCAAYAGIPLTERGKTLSVRFLTLYTQTLHDEDFWQSLKHAKKETFVFYMSTPHYGFLCQKLQEIGFAPQTPLVVIEQGTTPFHKQYTSTIGTFATDHDNSKFASPCTMIVGDVARLAEQNQWKQEQPETKDYFPYLEQEKKYA